MWKNSTYHSIFLEKMRIILKILYDNKEDFQIMLNIDNLLGLEDVIITKVQRNLNETLVFVELPRNTFIIIKNRQYELHDLNL